MNTDAVFGENSLLLCPHIVGGARGLALCNILNIFKMIIIYFLNSEIEKVKKEIFSFLYALMHIVTYRGDVTTRSFCFSPGRSWQIS